MQHAPQIHEIKLIAGGACALASVTLTLLGLLWLLWRQRRQLAGLDAAGTRLARERQARLLAEQALEDARRQVCHLSNSQQSLRDAERRRIARDLHDDLGQNLLALGFELAALSAQHPQLRSSIAQIDQRIQHSLRSMRAIVRDLRPEALDRGLQGAVEQQLEQFSRLSGIPCRLEAEADAFSNNSGAGMDKMLYRIIQESLSNIARHAQASQVSVGIRRAADHLSLTVRDNGIGLPPPTARRGAGLRGIAERVSEAGGRFDVASAPGMGTALTMSFPIP